MRRLVFLGVALAMLVHGARASDLPLPTKAPPPETSYDWTGFYAGAHLGYAGGSSNWSAPPFGGSLDFYNTYDMFKGTGSYFAGLQAGYNYLLPSRLILGIEADISFPNTFGGTAIVSSAATGLASYAEQVEMSGTVRGRIGYAPGNWLFYATGGLAWSYDQFTRNQLAGMPVGGTAMPGSAENLFMVPRVGGVAGAGIEMALTPNWAARLEYLYTGYASRSVSFPAGAAQFNSNLTTQSVRVGLDYQIGKTGIDPDLLTKGPDALELDRFAVHGQTTFIEQYDPSVPLALSRAAQPRSQPGTRKLGRHVFRRRQIVGRRRILDRSGNRPGFWAEQYRRHRRLSQRRLVQSRRVGAVFARSTRLCSADDRSWRRQRKGCGRSKSIRRREYHRTGS